MGERKVKNQVLDLYFRGRKYKEGLEEISLVFENLKIDLESFEKYCEMELEDIEQEVIRGYYMYQKSLKKIANEMDLSYSYVRRIYLDGKEKMRIILSLHIKDEELSLNDLEIPEDML